MPRGCQVLGGGSEGWEPACAHARDSTEPSQGQISDLQPDCDTSMTAEAMACRPLLEDWDGEGLRGVQGRRHSSRQVAQKGRAGVQAGLAYRQHHRFHPGALQPGSASFPAWEEGDAGAAITRCDQGHCPGHASPGRDRL